MPRACWAATAAGPSTTSTCTAASTSRWARCRKAVGVMGGYIAGRQHLKDFLIQRCRPLLFSTSQPPAVAAACIAAIDVLERSPSGSSACGTTRASSSRPCSSSASTRASARRPSPRSWPATRRKAQQLAARLFERGRLRHVGGLSHGAAGQGARAHDRDQRAHARRAPDLHRRVREGGSRAPPDLGGGRATGRAPWVCLDVGETLIDEIAHLDHAGQISWACRA